MEKGEIRKMIPESVAFVVKMPVKLEGSVKQTEWAGEIRKNVLKRLGIQTVNYLSDGRPAIGLWEIAKKGKDEVIENILNNPLVANAEGALKQEKIDDQIAAYQDLAKRIERLESITQNASAAWWIDNRNENFDNIINGK